MSVMQSSTHYQGTAPVSDGQWPQTRALQDRRTGYKTEKDAMTKELTNLTYSQVTGKGEGAQWIQDHYAEWGS